MNLPDALLDLTVAQLRADLVVGPVIELVIEETARAGDVDTAAHDGAATVKDFLCWAHERFFRAVDAKPPQLQIAAALHVLFGVLGADDGELWTRAREAIRAEVRAGIVRRAHAPGSLDGPARVLADAMCELMDAPKNHRLTGHYSIDLRVGDAPATLVGFGSSEEAASAEASEWALALAQGALQGVRRRAVDPEGGEGGAA